MRISTLKSIVKSNKPLKSERDFKSANIIIEIQNSFCTVISDVPEVLALIETTLTYDNQEVLQQIQQLKFQIQQCYRYKNFRRINWFKKKITELELNVEVCWFKESRFPTGHLNIVLDVLKEHKVSVSQTDLRVAALKHVALTQEVPFFQPRYYQAEMVALGLKHGRGVFASCVGSGKSLVMQLLTYELQAPTLIILPSKDLSVQTFDSFTQIFGSNSVELVDAVKNSKTKKPIRICTIHTLTSLKKKGLLSHFLKDIGVLCIDEAHHLGAASFSALLQDFDHVYYRFLFTATWMRNDSKTLDMYGFASTVLYNYPATKATEEGYLTPLKVMVHEVQGVPSKQYQTEYRNNYCENPLLLSKIKEILDLHTLPDAQVLILVGQKEKSGKVIHEYLNELGIDNEYVSGDSPREDVKSALLNFNAKRTKILIGSSVLGEGIDIRSSEHLIMAQGGKSELVITQALGRLVRLFQGKTVATVHDFRFLGTKYLESHLNKRLQIYSKNFNGEVVDVESDC